MLVELGPLLLNAASMIDPLYNQTGWKNLKISNFLKIARKWTGIPQLQYNPFGWSKNANLLAIDFPPPVGTNFFSIQESSDYSLKFVGFSYCLPAGVTGFFFKKKKKSLLLNNSSMLGGGTSCGPWNDTSTSENNHRAMVKKLKI